MLAQVGRFLYMTPLHLTNSIKSILDANGNPIQLSPSSKSGMSLVKFKSNQSTLDLYDRAVNLTSNIDDDTEEPRCARFGR